MSNNAHKFKRFLNNPGFVVVKVVNGRTYYRAKSALIWEDQAGNTHRIEPFVFDGHSIPKRLMRFFKRLEKRLRVAMLHDWFFENHDMHDWRLSEINAAYLDAGLWVCTHEGFSIGEVNEWLWARFGLLLGSWWCWLKDR